jgi:hypothetical protein
MRVSSNIVRNIPPAPIIKVSPKTGSRFAPKNNSKVGDALINLPILIRSIFLSGEYFFIFTLIFSCACMISSFVFRGPITQPNSVL